MQGLVSAGALAENAPSSILPVHPISRDDLEIIERWLASRQGKECPTAECFTQTDSLADLERLLYSDPPLAERIPSVFVSPKTIRDARSTLQAFCRRSPVSLREVGLVGDPGGLVAFEHGALRREIFFYAQDYAARMMRRLGPDGMERFALACQRHPGQTYPLFLSTSGWRKFATHARDLFDWMEREGLRPPGTNPLVGLRKFTEVSRSTGKVKIVMGWYRTVLAAPLLTPMERAFIYLLANGLRAGDVARLRISDLDFSRRRIYVAESDDAARIVPLLPWTIAAIDAWLNARRWSVSPWLFPGRKGRPFRRTSVFDLVRRVSCRVFPAPQQAHIVEHITPLGFRGYFAIVARRRRVDAIVIMDAMGTRSYEALLRYISVDNHRE